MAIKIDDRYMLVAERTAPWLSRAYDGWDQEEGKPVTVGWFEEADGLNVGSRAKVMSGPFADKIGLLDRMDENGRVRLLLDIMGGEVLVDVARANLLPAVE